MQENGDVSGLYSDEDSSQLSGLWARFLMYKVVHLAEEDPCVGMKNLRMGVSHFLMELLTRYFRAIYYLLLKGFSFDCFDVVLVH